MTQLMPLAMVSPGEIVRVAGIRAGWGLQRRLADMGLTPGVQIRVMNSQRPGPVMIDLRGSRVALGHGVAQKIMVTTHHGGHPDSIGETNRNLREPKTKLNFLCVLSVLCGKQLQIMVQEV